MHTKLLLTKADLKTITQIRKRSGEVVVFNIEKIARAALGAFQVTKEGGETEAAFIARKVYHDLLKLKKFI